LSVPLAAAAGIYYHSEAQRDAAVASRDREQRRVPRPIVTEILPASTWWVGGWVVRTRHSKQLVYICDNLIIYLLILTDVVCIFM
jgi:hypothetical protein